MLNIIKMIYKFIILLSILISILFSCNCQSQIEESNFDILNMGYNILKNLENRSQVFEQIDSIWETMNFHNLFEFSNKLDPEALMSLFGVPEITVLECLSVDGLKTLSHVNATCDEQILKNLQLIGNFRNHINSIIDYFIAIDSQYQNLKDNKILNNGDRLISQELKVTEHLYEFLSETCSDKSTCIFHEIGGIHFSEIGGTRPIATAISSSGEIYRAYLIIAVHILKGYITKIYHYHDSPITRNELKKIESLRAKFLMHTHSIAKLALSALKNASRDVTLGELSENDIMMGSAYIELKWFVGQIIVNEANLNPTGDCSYTCDDYKEGAMYYIYGSVPSTGKDICSGTISQCYRQPLKYLCLTEENSSRRYAGIRVEGGPLGNIDSCNNNDEKLIDDIYYVGPAFFHRCDVCTCLCDDYSNPETIRTFSLREVTSDIEENMVITGLRLREIDGMIYIQIQEGKLKDINVVEFVHWTPINTFDRRSESISYNDSLTLSYNYRNTVNLDTISTRDEFVLKQIKDKHPHSTDLFPTESYLLTGVKFETLHGHLNFGIRLTAWNSETRKLEVKKWDNWFFNRESITRKEIKMENPDDPTETWYNVEVEGDSYVKFQPTDNIKDFGQTTVPFLDARDVVTQPPMPLSGAGLFYKGKPGYGGFIGLKLISIDFSHLIITEVKDD